MARVTDVQIPNCSSNEDLDKVQRDMIAKVEEMIKEVQEGCHRIVDEGEPIPHIGPWRFELERMTAPYT